MRVVQKKCSSAACVGWIKAVQNSIIGALSPRRAKNKRRGDCHRCRLPPSPPMPVSIRPTSNPPSAYQLIYVGDEFINRPAFTNTRPACNFHLLTLWILQFFPSWEKRKNTKCSGYIRFNYIMNWHVTHLNVRVICPYTLRSSTNSGSTRSTPWSRSIFPAETIKSRVLRYSVSLLFGEDFLKTLRYTHTKYWIIHLYQFAVHFLS